MKTGVGLGDLLRAWDACNRDPDVLPQLARLLDLEPRRPLPPTPPITRPDPPRAPPEPPRPRSEERTSAGWTRTDTRVVLEPLPRAPTPPVPAWRAVSPLPRATPVPRPLPAPLFPPVRERSLLAAAARTLRDDAGIDVPAVVDAIARRTLPRPLPRRRAPSLRGGVQLVVDDGAWMAPFTDDIARLRVRLREVAGAMLEELVVSDLPPLVAAPPTRKPRPWAPPMPGTAVIVVSDLGRVARRNGRSDPEASWSSFLARVEAAGFAPIVLVPGRSARYRGRDSRRTLVLGWDRDARIAQVLQFVKDRR